MKTYFMFLAFILEPLKQFNTIFQTDATQIAILLPEMNHLLHVFMAKPFTMRAIKSAEDLTTVPFPLQQHIDSWHGAVHAGKR